MNDALSKYMCTLQAPVSPTFTKTDLEKTGITPLIDIDIKCDIGTYQEKFKSHATAHQKTKFTPKEKKIKKGIAGLTELWTQPKRAQAQEQKTYRVSSLQYETDKKLSCIGKDLFGEKSFHYQLLTSDDAQNDQDKTLKATLGAVHIYNHKVAKNFGDNFCYISAVGINGFGKDLQENPEAEALAHLNIVQILLDDMKQVENQRNFAQSSKDAYKELLGKNNNQDVSKKRLEKSK